MALSHLETVRAFWDACEREDYQACRPLIGSRYVWIDHQLGLVARTPEEHREAMQKDLAWTKRKFVITHAAETVDGALLVQARLTQTLAGEWCSVKGTGQLVTQDICEIFRFDSEGRIEVEELYSDALTVMRQLGALPR